MFGRGFDAQISCDQLVVVPGTFVLQFIGRIVDFSQFIEYLEITVSDHIRVRSVCSREIINIIGKKAYFMIGC